MIVSMYSYLIPVVLCIAQIIGTTSMGWANRRSLFSLPHAHLNNYSDHRRLMVRPLMHLGLSMPVGAEVEGYPLLYITSAFLGAWEWVEKRKLSYHINSCKIAHKIFSYVLPKSQTHGLSFKVGVQSCAQYSSPDCIKLNHQRSNRITQTSSPGLSIAYGQWD